MAAPKPPTRTTGAAVRVAKESASRILPPGDYAVGGGLGCDVVVPGCEVDVAARVVVGADGSVLVRVLAEGVSVAGSPVAVGEEVPLGPGEALGVGDEDAVLSRPKAGVTYALMTAVGRAMPAARGRSALGGARRGDAAVASDGREAPEGWQRAVSRAGGRGPAGASLARTARRWAPAATLLAAGLALLSLTPDPLGESARGAGGLVDTTDGKVAGLRLGLAEADLAERLTVTPRGDRVAVTGRLDPEGRARWHDVKAASETRGPRVLDEVAGIEPPGETLVAAVVLAPRVFVLGTDRKAYGPGTTLPQGWSVVSITAAETVLEKDGERRVVRY